MLTAYSTHKAEGTEEMGRGDGGGRERGRGDGGGRGVEEMVEGEGVEEMVEAWRRERGGGDGGGRGGGGEG